jgi:TonB-dependent receptor
MKLKSIICCLYLKKNHFHLILAVFYFLLLSNILDAQGKGSISGKVIDASNGSPLWGANILVKNTSIGTNSSDEGKYRINLIPAGKIIIAFRYLGYETIEKEVIIEENKVINVDVQMKETAILGKEVVVSAQRQGQQAAINQQLSSNSIVNVVSKDKIQELPDQNAAESLSRLPGISIQRDGGEGQKVVIRGLSPKYNIITINDEKIPSTDENDRSVDLSSVSSDMLAGIEVYKSVTSDKDGDAIGGVVNFTVKKAPDDFRIDIKIQDGYSSQEKYYGNRKGSFSISNRFLDNSLGVVLAANVQRADRSSDGLDVSYLFAGSNTQTGNSAIINVANLNLTDIKETRDRYGASLSLDYNLGNGGLFFNGFWSRTDRDQDRRRKRYRIDVSRTEYDFRETKTNLDLYTANLSGNHNFDLLQLSWRAAFSESKQHTPFEFYNNFQELSPFKANIITDQGPELIPLGAKNDLSSTFFKESDITERNVIDKNFTLQIDGKRNFEMSKEISGYLKLGGKFRWKTRDRENSKYWTDNFNINYMAATLVKNPDQFYRNFNLTGDNKIKVTNFFSNDDLVGDFLEGRYTFGPSLDKNSLLDFLNNMRNVNYAIGKPLFVKDKIILLDNYTASENVFAGYIMSEINFTSNLLLLPGVRVERTYNDYKSIFGTPIRSEDNTPDLAGAKDTVGTQIYYDILPSIQVRYKIFDWLDIRAAVTRTLSRPNYFDLVPFQNISVLDNTIAKGNPVLRQTKVWNYDLYFSTYNTYGLFTLGGFYKKLSDVSYIRQARVQDGGLYNGFTLTQPVNADLSSWVYGGEIELQANFAMLPSPFDGIVFYANFSLMKSKTYFPFFAIGPRSTKPPFQASIIDTVREGNMPNQADKIGNISFGYEKGGFSGRISLVFQGKSLAIVGTRAELDGYSDQFYRLDISVQQKIINGFSIFLNANNLTNVPDRSYLGVERFPTSEDYYGWTLDLGIKYKF